MPIERLFETRRISIMRGSTQVLVKVVLFQLGGHGHPQGDATLNFFPDSKSFLLGLSNEVSFVSGFLRNGVKKSKSILLGLSNEVLNFSLLQLIEKKLGINRNQLCVPCGY